MALTVRTEPCSSCPYRRDVPSGVWHREEYEKLLQYDDSTEILPAFMCHQPAEHTAAACRGWLEVNLNTITVRMAQITGRINMHDLDRPPRTPLFASGREAHDHGVAEITNPTPAARAMAAGIARKQQRFQEPTP